MNLFMPHLVRPRDMISLYGVGKQSELQYHHLALKNADGEAFIDDYLVPLRGRIVEIRIFNGQFEPAFKHRGRLSMVGVDARVAIDVDGRPRVLNSLIQGYFRHRQDIHLEIEIVPDHTEQHASFRVDSLEWCVTSGGFSFEIGVLAIAPFPVKASSASASPHEVRSLLYLPKPFVDSAYGDGWDVSICMLCRSPQGKRAAWREIGDGRYRIASAYRVRDSGDRKCAVLFAGYFEHPNLSALSLAKTFARLFGESPQENMGMRHGSPVYLSVTVPAKTA